MHIPQTKRSRIFIDREFQLRFIFNNTVFLLFMAFVVGLGTYVGVWHSITHEIRTTNFNYNPAVEQSTDISIARMPIIKNYLTGLNQHQLYLLNQIMIKTNWQLIPVIGVFIALMVFSSLVFSHRIAGPIYRLKQNLNAAIGGDLTSVFSTRKRDELRDVVDRAGLVVNRFAQDLHDIGTYALKIKNTNTPETIYAQVERIEMVLAKYKVKR